MVYISTDMEDIIALLLQRHFLRWWDSTLCLWGLLVVFLFGGSSSNAARQALEIAGAKHERRLFPVACTRLLGPVLVPGAWRHGS
jgi:hypothetical protein